VLQEGQERSGGGRVNDDGRARLRRSGGGAHGEWGGCRFGQWQ
jgi:hypothetical protein